VEASTESEWVAQHREQLGHDVIVADPNYLPMYGHRSRRIKTDRRDVAALVVACQHGTYRLVHRRSARHQEVQRRLKKGDRADRERPAFGAPEWRQIPGASQLLFQARCLGRVKLRAQRSYLRDNKIAPNG
jgi:hypothetical protein